MSALRLGTRRSTLATTQSRWVAEELRAATGRDVELVEVVTEGDRNRAPITTLGGTGIFVSALRQALQAGEVDFAVHSLKDLPTVPEDGIALAAVPGREDPRDVLIARDGLTLGELPTGARVGTGSPRRAAQLRALGLGLEIVGLRGNIETRLAAVTSGRLDAILLARSGLLRLGRADVATEILDPLQVLPAPGQGALAVECRSDDAATLATLDALDDEATRACAQAERALLATLEGGCSAPIGALAEWAEGDDGPELFLRGAVVAHDGSVDLRRSLTGPVTDPEGLGARLARIFLDDGARGLVDADPVFAEHLTAPGGAPPGDSPPAGAVAPPADQTSPQADASAAGPQTQASQESEQ